MRQRAAALHGTLASGNSAIRNRGVREASFVVLTGTEMPSILAEISFVSSPADEERLRSASYREQIAEALYKGIEHFAASTHRVKMAQAATPSDGTVGRFQGSPSAARRLSLIADS